MHIRNVQGSTGKRGQHKRVDLGTRNRAGHTRLMGDTHGYVPAVGRHNAAVRTLAATLASYEAHADEYIYDGNSFWREEFMPYLDVYEYSITGVNCHGELISRWSMEQQIDWFNQYSALRHFTLDQVACMVTGYIAGYEDALIDEHDDCLYIPAVKNQYTN